MKQKLLFFRPIVVVLSIAFLAAGCGGGTPKEPPVELVIWKTFTDSTDYRPFIEAYQKLHSNVRITYVKKSEANYEESLLNALAEGQGPDIFSINNTWLPKYINKLEPAPTWKYSEYKDAFVETAVSDFTKDQKVYGVPLSIDTLALYYNKDLLFSAGLATPPKTWSEFAKDARILTRQNQQGYFTTSGASLGLSSQAPGGQVHRAEDVLYLLMLQNGVTPWQTDGSRPRFADSNDRLGNRTDPGLNALDFYTSFARPQSVNYTWNSLSDYSIDAFANGRSAMIIDYAFSRAIIAQKSATLNFDVAPVPQANLTDPEVNFANYWGETVSKQTKHKDYAWDFLYFISSKDQLSKFSTKTGLPSSRRDLIEEQADDPEIGVFAHSALTAKPFYRPDQGKIDDIFNNMIDQVTLKAVTPAQALQQASQQASTVTIPRN